MYMCRLRHINDSVLSSLKMEGIRSFFFYNGYWVSFPWKKRPGRGVDHSPLSSAEVKERVELYLYSPLGSLWAVLREKNYTPETVILLHSTRQSLNISDGFCCSHSDVLDLVHF
jgi:hypothetical protein